MTLKVETVVLPGHRIEIQAPDLPEGRHATVLVLVDEPSPPPKRRLSEILEGYEGGQFRTGDEVDAYLRAERDSWDR